MILYFSGTGNSTYVAKSLAALTGDEMISIFERIHERDHTPVSSREPLIFVVPTYAWRIPKLVEEWILKMRFKGNTKAYFVMTCGDSIGNAAEYLKKLCEKKDFSYMGVKKIVMPENYIAIFEAPEEPEAIAAVMRADYYIEEAAKSILKKEAFEEVPVTKKDKLASSVVNELFYLFLVKDKKFFVTEDCVSCGHCVETCPLHNIKMVDGIPKWNGKCTHCMRCICECPTCAVEYGRNSYGKWRYRCPVEID